MGQRPRAPVPAGGHGPDRPPCRKLNVFGRLRSLRGRFASVMVVLAILIGLRLVSVDAFVNQLATAQADAANERQVQLREEDLLSAMLDEETGIRGFADTGDT